MNIVVISDTTLFVGIPVDQHPELQLIGNVIDQQATAAGDPWTRAAQLAIVIQFLEIFSMMRAHFLDQLGIVTYRADHREYRHTRSFRIRALTLKVTVEIGGFIADVQPSGIGYLLDREEFEKTGSAGTRELTARITGSSILSGSCRFGSSGAPECWRPVTH
jgi:hypothetical protein